MVDISQAVSYHYGAFPPEKLAYDSLLKPLLSATESLARYDQMLKNLHNNEILLAPLRSREAVISSRMEGTVSTMDEIMEFEAKLDAGDKRDEVRSEIIETFLYQRTLKNAQEKLQEGYEISESLIKQMHQQLLGFGRGASKSPGAFKQQQNYVGEKGNRKISFIPISPEQLPGGLEMLLEFLKTNPFPTLIKAALMHLEFEALHPFQDGNGRIGRMLITLYLWKSGVISQPHFYISDFLEENKSDYIRQMRNVSSENKWEDWCAFFLDALHQQALSNIDIANKIQLLYEEMKTAFTDILSSKWTMHVLDYLFTYPKFRLPNFTKISGIPNNTSTKFIKRLLETNLLEMEQPSTGRKPALYSFEPLMKIVRV